MKPIVDLDYVVVPTLIVLVSILIAWFSMRRALSLRNKTLPTWSHHHSGTARWLRKPLLSQRSEDSSG